jgi:hypothetical protein
MFIAQRHLLHFLLMHLFCQSLSFLAEAQPRLETGEDKGHLLAEVHLKFLGDRTSYKAKDIIGTSTNLFCIYVYFSNRYIY